MYFHLLCDSNEETYTIFFIEVELFKFTRVFTCKPNQINSGQRVAPMYTKQTTTKGKIIFAFSFFITQRQGFLLTSVVT